MNETENHILETIKTLYFQNDNKPIKIFILHKNLKGMEAEKVAKILRKLKANSLIKFDERSLTVEPMGKE